MVEVHQEAIAQVAINQGKRGASEKQKEMNTRTSSVVTNHSTIRACRCLASESGRVLAFSSKYGPSRKQWKTAYLGSRQRNEKTNR